MGKAIRIGIVGARFAARFHYEGLRRVHGIPVEVVGVTSKTPEARDAFAAQMGIHQFETIESLCEAVDVLDLCSPPSTHVPLALQGLERGKHVIIEKPFTGYYGPPADDFLGNIFPKQQMLDEAMASCEHVLSAARKSGKRVC